MVKKDVITVTKNLENGEFTIIITREYRQGVLGGVESVKQTVEKHPKHIHPAHIEVFDGYGGSKKVDLLGTDYEKGLIYVEARYDEEGKKIIALEKIPKPRRWARILKWPIFIGIAGYAAWWIKQSIRKKPKIIPASGAA